MLVPLQAGCELRQGLEEVGGSSSGLLAEAPPPPAQLSELNVSVLNLLEQLRHHLDHEKETDNNRIPLEPSVIRNVICISTLLENVDSQQPPQQDM